MHAAERATPKTNVESYKPLQPNVADTPLRLDHEKELFDSDALVETARNSIMIQSLQKYISQDYSSADSQYGQT